MKYLKVFVDFAKAQEALNDAEFGRLIRAMVDYASDGSAPDLRGNERYAWGAAKLSIDQQSGSYSNKVAGAEKAREKRSDIKANQNDINTENLISTQVKNKNKTIKEIPSYEGTKKSRAFQPPTLDEVKARCAEKGYTLDPEAFMSYYNANGWKVGRNKMVSWESALAGWESREKQYRKPAKQNAALKYEQKPIPEDNFNAMVVDLTGGDYESC